eukprot:gi/632938692/ref/XP_007905990.1/ PREDICTED: uncharacterized protein LOC103188008 [Callorhinchus milii]
MHLAVELPDSSITLGESDYSTDWFESEDEGSDIFYSDSESEIKCELSSVMHGSFAYSPRDFESQENLKTNIKAAERNNNRALQFRQSSASDATGIRVSPVPVAKDLPECGSTSRSDLLIKTLSNQTSFRSSIMASVTSSSDVCEDATNCLPGLRAVDNSFAKTIVPIKRKREKGDLNLATEETNTLSEGDIIFAEKCGELQGFIPPLNLLLNGLKSGRYRKGLTSFQESVAMDRIQRILGVLQNPNLGEQYTGILLQVERMLKGWFPNVALVPGCKVSLSEVIHCKRLKKNDQTVTTTHLSAHCHEIVKQIKRTESAAFEDEGWITSGLCKNPDKGIYKIPQINSKGKVISKELHGNQLQEKKQAIVDHPVSICLAADQVKPANQSRIYFYAEGTFAGSHSYRCMSRTKPKASPLIPRNAGLTLSLLT